MESAVTSAEMLAMKLQCERQQKQHHRQARRKKKTFADTSFFLVKVWHQRKKISIYICIQCIRYSA